MIKRLHYHFLFFIFNFLAVATVLAQVYAYIPNKGSNTVSVIDVASQTVVATIPVGTSPFSVAVSPNGSRVYIVNQGSNTVSVINTNTNAVTATVSLIGTNHQGVAVNPDGSKVYVINNSPPMLEVIDAATNTLLPHVYTGTGSAPLGIVLSPDGTKFYIADFGLNSLLVLNAATGAYITQVIMPDLSSPTGVAVSPDGSRIYVTNNAKANVAVIDATTYSLITTIPVGAFPLGVTVSPDGTKVYVASETPGQVSVILALTNTVLATIPTGNDSYGISITPDGKQVYATNAGSNNVSIINTLTNTVTNTVAVGTNPYSFGRFITTAPAAGSPLPVHFTGLTAREQPNGAVEIEWNVAEQTTGTFYEAERSVDGRQFTKLGTIAATEKNGSANYSWIDVTSTPGINYYRVKLTELSGKTNYSQVVKLVTGSGKPGINLYPNPVTGQVIKLQMVNEPRGVYSVEVVNSMGQQIFNARITHSGGSSVQTIQLPAQLSKGNYQVNVFSETTRCGFKISVY